MKMLKAFAAALALTLCAALSATAADPPSIAGRLNYISGPVSFAPAQANEEWSAAVINRPITTGDRLWTDAGGRAEMHVGSLAIRMAPQTSLDVLNLDDRTIQLRLAQGATNLRVRRLGSDQLLEIATPSGAVVVREPGSYRINVDSSGVVVVTVRAGGQAEVFTGNSSFLVRDQQQATVSGSRQDLFAAAPTDEFDRWAAERDQRKERVVSTRYVPEEMTGYEDLDEYGSWHTVPTYGAVWRPRAVPTGWAPYRYGHWVWVAPWGWTWVDDQPWGYAPSHYGRWVWLSNHWAWAPGRRVERPVYAPALVAFIGGSNWSVSVGAGSAPVVGWVPLGWREPYRPWYRASHDHVRNVNVTHVTNINVTNITNNVTNVRLVNRNAPSAVTVVSRDNFVRARRVQDATVRVSAQAAAKAPVTRGAPVATPARESLAVARSGQRPPSEVRTRETIVVNTPPAPARDVDRAERKGKGKGRDEARVASRDNDDRPRVRVIDRQQAQRVELQPSQAQAPAAAQQQAKGAERAPDKAGTQAQQKGAPQHQPVAPQPQAQAQGKADAKADVRAQDKGAVQPQPGAQAERRVPAPPADVSKRPTFDRDMRETKREQRQAERQEQQAERQKAQQQQQQQAVQERQAREQQARQQAQQQQQAERQQAQQQRQQQAAQERQAREQQARQAREQQAQQQQAERQRAQQQAAQARQQQQQAAQAQARQQQQQQRQREKAEKSDKKRDDEARNRRGDRAEKG